VQFLVDAKHYGEVGVTAESPNWSIKEGDLIGEISYVSPAAELTGTPIAAARGFFYSVDPGEVSTFATSANRGFELLRDGQPIAEFGPGNLAEQIQKLMACAARLHAEDPFAQPVYAPSAGTSQAQPASPEAATVSPV
jgi:hypothetical protein